MSESHAPGLYAAVIASRPELLPWMPWALEPTLEASVAMTRRDEKAWREERVFQFVLVEKEKGDELGVAGLDREGAAVAALHYWIRSDHTGRGLTTEAARALVDWARDELHLERLTLWAGSENRASRRVAEKLGFMHVGPLDWRPDGGLGDFPAESYELRFSS